MFYCHRVSTDQDFLNDEPEDLLTIQYVETFCGLTNTGQKLVYPTHKGVSHAPLSADDPWLALYHNLP
jgi:hypothetical protein